MHTFIIAAQSLDGFIAQSEEQVSTEWTSAEDKKFFSQKSKEAGVMVMGKTTFNTIKRPLPGRVSIVYSRSGKLETEFEVRKLEDSPDSLEEKVVYTTSLSPQELIAVLEKKGFEQVAICGGSSIYSLFLEAGVVDTLFLTIEPVVFGEGVKLFSHLDQFQKLKLIAIRQLSEQTMVGEYAVRSFS